MNNIRIVPFDAKYKEAFARLNLAWIERFFVVEPHDLEQLHEPEKWILPNGGEILIALDEAGELIGTCALIANAPGEFEMAKMCVAENQQGRGIGKLLCRAAIEWVRGRGAKRIWLESNRKQVAAIEMYRKMGFIELPAQETPYARCDIWMEILL